MARSVSPLLVLAFTVLILNSLVMIIEAPVTKDSGEMTTDKTDYFIGERVQARFTIRWTGGSAPLLPMIFEWFTPANATIFNETLDMIPYQVGNTKYLGAYSNWTSNMNGTDFRVRGTHNDSGEFGESYFNIWHYEEAAYVESLTLSVSNSFYENNSASFATATLGYLGNGTKLGNVSFEWRYPNSTVAFSENVSIPDGGMNGTVEANSSWTIDFVGTGFEVQATYNGVEPLTDTAIFDVIPERVETWKNGSVSASVTWTRSGSPYGICNNITVQQGATLTIEAGSVIRFCPDTGMTVRGALVMAGSLPAPINLTSYSHPSSPGDWKSITFEDESDDVGSILSHVITEYSQRGIVLNGASPAIFNVSVANSSISGVEVIQSEVFLSEVYVTDSSRGIYSKDSKLDLVDSEILRCTDGVVMEDSNGTLSGNWIHHNTERGIWAVRSNPTITFNTINWNANKGIRLEDSSGILVEGNAIGWSNLTFDSYQSTDLTLKGSFISNGASAGLSFWSSEGVLVENSTVATSTESFRVMGGSVVRALNCTFNDTLVRVTGGSRLYVENYLDVKVMDTTGTALEGATLTLTLDGVPMVIGTTGTDGWMRWIVIRYESFSGVPQDPDITQVFLEVDMDGYNITDSLRQVNMSVTHTETFIGTEVWQPGGNGDDAQMLLIVGVIAAVILVAVALYSIYMLIIKRRRKPEEPEEVDITKLEMEDGRAYVVSQDGSGRGFQRLEWEIRKGSKGLCFSRTYPENLKKQYDIEGSKVFWLSRDMEKGGLVPTNLGLITNEVEKFLKEDKDSRRIVLLDGMEYLIAQNDFGKVLKLVNYLKDTIGVNKGILLIPFNLKSIEEKEAAMLTADLEVV